MMTHSGGRSSSYWWLLVVLLLLLLSIGLLVLHVLLEMVVRDLIELRINRLSRDWNS
jgi:hypothetical protein